MRARTLLSMATLVASAACSSFPRPAETPTPAVSSGEAPGLAVWTPSSTGGVGSLMSGATFFTADRDGYAAAFAVTRDGRLRVVWPESPSDDGLVRAGRTYRANGSFAQYGAWMGGVRNAVPYVFVIVSDRRPDLSRFGSGSKWKYQVSLDRLGHYAEDAIETVASVVLPGPEASYAADYAFLAPRLSGQAQLLTMYCGVRNTDARNYAYFRDLWATFDPWDNSLGALSFSSGWNFWPGAMFPMGGRGSSLAFYADRASRATAAFWGGCPGLTPFTRTQYAYYYTAPLVAYQPPTPTFAPGDPLSPTMQAPGTLAPGTDSTGATPGELLRIRPSPIFGGPGVVAPGVAAATGGEEGRAERQARLRDRMEQLSEARGRGERSAEGAAERMALRAERLAPIDVGRLEGRLRTTDEVERGLATFGERNGGRAGGYGRAGRYADDGFGGRSGAVGVPRGAARGRSEGGSGSGVVGAARPDGGVGASAGTASQVDPGSRTAGAESRGGEARTGTVGEVKSRTP